MPKTLELAFEDIAHVLRNPNIFLNAGPILEQIANAPFSRHEIFLVSDEQYQDLAKTILHYLTREKGRPNSFNISNGNLYLNGIDKQSCTQAEILDSLQIMRDKSISGKKSILIGTMDSILSIGNPYVKDKDSEYILRDPENPSREGDITPHLMYLLATEGKHIDLNQFKLDNLAQPEIAMIIISTPAKWNEFVIESRYS